MPKTTEDQLRDLEELAERIQEDVKEIRSRITKSEDRVERFINGEKDLSAKGVLERLIVMEAVYKQYEGLVRVFDWVNVIIKWGVRLAPLVGAAMAYIHYYLGSTNDLFKK